MTIFLNYLNAIENLRKQRKFDEAWKLANEGVTEIRKEADDLWYLMYYQMALICATEKRWGLALFYMAMVFHYHGGPGGITHYKQALRFLKKFGKEKEYEKFLKISLETDPQKLSGELSKFTDTLPLP